MRDNIFRNQNSRRLGVADSHGLDCRAIEAES